MRCTVIINANDIHSMDEVIEHIESYACYHAGDADKIVRTARRFVLAYGVPIDYMLYDEYRFSNLGLNFYWGKLDYTVKVNEDGSIVFLDDAKVEIPLDTVSDSGWFARVHNALEEAATVAPQAVKKDSTREINFPTMIASNQNTRHADKTQVVKMLGKASELSATVSDYKMVEERRKHVADALADSLQALANLVDAYQLTNEEITEAVKLANAKERDQYQHGE